MAGEDWHIISRDEVSALEDVDFQLQQHEGTITTSNVENYLKHPVLLVSYPISIHFKQPPHTRYSKTTCHNPNAFIAEQMGEYNAYNGCSSYLRYGAIMTFVFDND